MHITRCIYSKLPKVIIDYILCFNPQFIIRKGKLISIISKNDERYKILEYITLKPVENSNIYYSLLGMSNILDKRYQYEFHNQFNNLSSERRNQFIVNDRMNVSMTIYKNGTIKYSIKIYKLKPIEICNNHLPRFYKGNMNDCNWNFIEYQYTRI